MFFWFTICFFCFTEEGRILTAQMTEKNNLKGHTHFAQNPNTACLSEAGGGGVVVIHGNISGLREIRLLESEFVCNNNTNYSLSLRSLGHAGGRNWELQKLGGWGQGWINLLSCESGVGARGRGEGVVARQRGEVLGGASLPSSSQR